MPKRYGVHCCDCTRFGRDCDAGDVDGNEDCAACERFVGRGENGNAAKLRAAAEDMERFLTRHQPTAFLWAASEPKKGPDELWAEFCEIDVRMEAALDSPARNCDRGRDAAEDAFTARFGRPWTEEEARVAEWLFEEEGRTGAARQDMDGEGGE